MICPPLPMNTMNSIKLERKHIEVICEVREYVCDAYDELELPANFDLVDAQEKKPKFVKEVMPAQTKWEYFVWWKLINFPKECDLQKSLSKTLKIL